MQCAKKHKIIKVFRKKVLPKLNKNAMIQLQKQKRKNKDTKDKIFGKTGKKT